MKRFILFITLGFLIIGCQEGVEPSPDSFCIFQRNQTIDAGDIGSPTWTFLRCEPDPEYKITDYNKYTGYQTTDCKCGKVP